MARSPSLSPSLPLRSRPKSATQNQTFISAEMKPGRKCLKVLLQIYRCTAASSLHPSPHLQTCQIAANMISPSLTCLAVLKIFGELSFQHNEGCPPPSTPPHTPHLLGSSFHPVQFCCCICVITLAMASTLCSAMQSLIWASVRIVR